jgi:hypothetical protein
MIRLRQEIRTDHLQTLPAQLIALGIVNLEMLHGHKKIINEVEEESDGELDSDDRTETGADKSHEGTRE